MGKEQSGRMYHIVYAADHNYMLYCCVSVYSLLDHLPERSPVCVHLLLDESISSDDEALFGVLAARFPEAEFRRHLISEEFFRERDFSDSLWSRAACYRLLLPELLTDVDVCLYLDSDTLVVRDITPVFETDLEDAYIAGVFDDIAPVREQTVGNEIPGIDTYINSGVLLMNLESMRRNRIGDLFHSGISRYLVVDQDLLNVSCYGHIRLLPSEYNCIPGVHADEPRILHFLMRDYLRPWKNRRAAGSKLWWEYAEHFQDATDLDLLRAGADWFRRGSITWLFRRCADFDRVYVLGSGSDARRIFRALRLGKCRSLRGAVGEEDCISYDADTLIICASRRKNVPALKRFMENEGAGRQVVFYEKWPVSFYNLLPRECAKEVYGELLQWEYGVDGRQVMVPSDLLEINAARFPDAEACVLYRDSDGMRSAISFREANRLSNRVASMLLSRKNVRGKHVLAGKSTGTEAGPFAVFLGILKAGCVADPDAQEEGEPSFSGTADAAGKQYCERSPESGERYSDKSPEVDVLPDEPAAVIGGKLYTHRALMEHSERLRRRIGWNRGDKVLLAGADPLIALDLRIAALLTGSVTVQAEQLSAARIAELMNREKCTVAALGQKELKQMVTFLEGKPAGGEGGEAAISFGKCRMLLCGEIREELLVRWKAVLPHIPVNGQGYEGQFRYECEWFIQ